MKILFLNHNYENFGTYWRCFYLAKYLSLKGIMIDLVCASRKNFDLGIKIRRENSNFKIITIPRVRFHEYHTGHNIRGLINSELVFLREYDILHSFAVAQPATALPTIIAGLFRNKPIVVDWDDIWGAGFGAYHPGFINKILSICERYIPLFADRITVVSDFLMNRAISYGYNVNKIIKIPNAANVDAIKPIDKYSARNVVGLPLDGKIVLSIGHTFMGNIEMFMKVINETVKNVSDIKFYLIGNIGSAGKNLISNKNLFILGEQPFSKIPFYLASADILILPMGKSDIEEARWPIRFGDYLSSGRPVVSNAVGEVRKILNQEKCGIATEPDDIVSFSKAIVDLIYDIKLQKELGEKARYVAENKYSWQFVADNLLKLYKTLI